MAGKKASRSLGTDVTPEQAKVVWESFGKPSLRRVEGAFAAVGRKIDFQTLARWRNNGWVRERHNLNRTLAETAVDNLDTCVPALTGHPATRIADLVEPADPKVHMDAEYGVGTGRPADLAAELDELQRSITGMSDEALMRTEAREMKITNIVLQRVLQRKAVDFLTDNMGGVSEVIAALGAYPAGSNECYDKMIAYRERAAQVINGTSPASVLHADEKDPLIAGIEKYEKDVARKKGDAADA